MKKIHLIIASIFVYASIISIIHYFRIGGENYYDLITTIINVISLLIGVYFGFKTIRYFGIKSLQGKSSLFITLNLFLFLIGDLFWMIYEEAVVSWADVFWLTAYPILGIGIYYGFKIIDPDFFRRKKDLAIIILMLLILLFSYFKFFPLVWDPEITIVENIVTYGYIVVDLILLEFIFLLLFLIYTLRQGAYSRTWIALAIGSVFILVADIYYAINYETYTNGDLIDLGWYFGYLFYALSLILVKHHTEIIVNNIKNVNKK